VKGQPSPIYRRILELVDACPARGATKLVAIDGRGGSGKSSLAAQLMSIDHSLKLLPVDHFPCRSDEYPLHPTGVQTRVSEARLLKALLPLIENDAGAYRRSWWHIDRVGPLTRVEPGGTVLVEGCYSLLPSLRSLYDFSIWVECEYEQALAQAVARDEKVGESDRVRWELGHAPSQERYIETHRPSEFADMVILFTPDAQYRILRF